MPCSPACLLVDLLAALVLAQDPQPTPTPVSKPGGTQQQQQPAKAPDPASVPAQERARPADAKTLLAVFARMPGLEATYTEEKKLALLALPLKSRGRIFFLPPGYLFRAVEAP